MGSKSIFGTNAEDDEQFKKNLPILLCKVKKGFFINSHLTKKQREEMKKILAQYNLFGSELGFHFSMDEDSEDLNGRCDQFPIDEKSFDIILDCLQESAISDEDFRKIVEVIFPFSSYSDFYQFKDPCDLENFFDRVRSLNLSKIEELIRFKFGLTDSIRNVDKSFFDQDDLKEIFVGYREFHRNDDIFATVPSKFKKLTQNLLLLGAHYLTRFSQENPFFLGLTSVKDNESLQNVIKGISLLREITFSSERKVIESEVYSSEEFIKLVEDGLFDPDDKVTPLFPKDIDNRTFKAHDVPICRMNSDIEIRRQIHDASSLKVTYKKPFELLGESYHLDKKGDKTQGCNSFVLYRPAWEHYNDLDNPIFMMTFYHELCHCIFKHSVDNRRFKSHDSRFVSVKHEKEQEAQRFSTVLVSDDDFSKFLYSYSKKQPPYYKISDIKKLWLNSNVKN